jgi:hypothetical protein
MLPGVKSQQSVYSLPQLILNTNRGTLHIRSPLELNSRMNEQLGGKIDEMHNGDKNSIRVVDCYTALDMVNINSV